MKLTGRILLCAALLGVWAMPAHAAPEDEPTALAMTGDLLVARPLGIVVTAIGAAAFVVSLPFSAAGGNVEQAADTLVIGPARETFVRCLGCRSAGRHQQPR
jgi:hypothetical protein